MKILIVEDSESNHLLLERILAKAGYNDIEIAESASDAYRILHIDDTDGPSTGVDLILMDILMPGVDGLTACRRIKRLPSLSDVPVIMVTAKSDIESLQSAFDAGAMDYITKPFKKPELLARVRSALALKSETDRRKAREIEIAEIGARIQTSLLRAKPPADLTGVRVAALSIPSQRIDGDFFDFYRPAAGLLDLLVADIMGKGVPAALLGAAAKTHFLQAVNRLMSQIDECGAKRVPTPEDIVGTVQMEMTEELMELESFITLCYARLDVTQMCLHLIDCGHVPTIHYRAASGTCRWIQGENLPMGIKAGEVLQAVKVSISPGDVLFFYSDGVTEAQNAEGLFFGEERLVDSVSAHGDLDPETLVEEVRDAVQRFAGRQVRSDDLTCVAVCVDDPAALARYSTKALSP